MNEERPNILLKESKENTRSDQMSDIEPKKPLLAKLTVKHQLCIPKPIVEALGLAAGDYVRFELTEDKMVIISKL